MYGVTGVRGLLLRSRVPEMDLAGVVKLAGAELRRSEFFAWLLVSGRCRIVRWSSTFVTSVSH